MEVTTPSPLESSSLPMAEVAEQKEAEVEFALFAEDVATRGLIYLTFGVVALLVVIALIVTCLAAAPTVTALVLLAIVVLASFVATEDGGSLMGWHASWEYENRFWGIWWMSIGKRYDERERALFLDDFIFFRMTQYSTNLIELLMNMIYVYDC